jgi:hypothetical protein
MYTMRDVQRITGLSRDQLRDRLGHLEPIAAQDRTRGPRNALIVGDRTIAYLRRMQELERDDLGPQMAAAQVINEVRENENHRMEERPNVATDEAQLSPTAGPGDAWRLVIASKDDSIRRLESEVIFLRTRVENLERLALPSPRRGILRLFRAGSG